MKNKLYVSFITIALLLVIGWTGESMGQRSNAARQTWEYRIEGAPTYSGPGSFVDPAAAQQQLNQEGAQGFELVSVAGGQPLFYLKRPR